MDGFGPDEDSSRDGLLEDGVPCADERAFTSQRSTTLWLFSSVLMLLYRGSV